MTKRYPVPYFVKKEITKAANADQWKKEGTEPAPAREAILEAIKRRAEAKKKKR